jgi:hypothetical protein
MQLNKDVQRVYAKDIRESLTKFFSPRVVANILKYVTERHCTDVDVIVTAVGRAENYDLQGTIFRVFNLN